MEYTVAGLARLSGLSARAIRYYDGLALLRPGRKTSAGYRVYGPEEVERLRQIMLYRELGFPLEDIKELVDIPGFDTVTALRGHLERLTERRERLDALIANVKKSILETEGAVTMTDREKFEGFKRELVADNERKYGGEIREKYGKETVERSNNKLLNMSEAEYEEVQRLSSEVDESLAGALKTGDPKSPEALAACEKHRQWLCHFWTEYSPEAHAGLGRMYVDDERFKAYYDRIAPGAAEFLRDALAEYTRAL